MGMLNSFGYRKLHSLVGFVPIGGYLFIHFLINFQATKGPEAFNRTVQLVESMPFLLALEFFLIYIPILYHAILGIYIAFESKNNIVSYRYGRNYLFFLQRITGIITFFFIVWHVWETRIQYALGRTELNYDMMNEILTNPAMFIFYLVGVISAVFHFSNGLWSFLIHWGITVSPKSQKVSSFFSIILFLILSFVTIRTMLAFL
ncbi:succinate dehydrogenase cytochrome b558 subunit [Neobacillus sp. GCM10023253]|uniref:succinate dehydrogenase cytochrome b558 subunit n=1 Tax=Neobacillus sp. GCM10023253 TaxID=3252644 RepID=UPI00361454D7